MNEEKFIIIRANGKEARVPNAWEVLTSEQYLYLVELLLQLQDGHSEPGSVRVRFLCHCMKWDLRKALNKGVATENLFSLASQITFIFRKIPEGMGPELNLCFCHQLLPVVFVDEGHSCFGYDVSVKFQTLTCSLTALQFLEARQLLAMGEESLPMLAAVLYCPGDYSSEKAQKLAEEFKKLPRETLYAIALNFEALNNFIFTQTEFSLLTKFKEKKGGTITTDATDALYDLSKDGLGNVHQVERMNVLTYLRILRKKTIEGVKALKASGMDIVKISSEVGLPIQTVREIL